jgi:proteic killer suppression protein
MVRSVLDATTQDIWDGTNSKAARRIPKELWKNARRKIDMIDSASGVESLKVPPSNGLHALKGSRDGQHAIKINAQYRVCFRMENGDAFDVEVTDYHDE